MKWLFFVLTLASSFAFAEKYQREGTGLIFPSEVANIDVVQVSGNSFRAYYMKSDGNIYSALSSDDGATFTEEGIRLAGQHPALMKLTDGRVRIYYTDGATGDLLSSISDDGLTFTAEDGIRLAFGEPGKIIHPHIVSVPKGGYRMYYDQEDTESMVGFGKNILSLFSEDGLTFERENGVRIGKRTPGFAKLRKPGLFFSPFAIYKKGKVHLYFTAENDNKKKKSGVWIAKSKNGKKFTVLTKALGIDPAVTEPSPGPGGLTGNPQDTFIITTSTGGKRMYVWQAQEGIFSAIPE